jgi:2-hydroxy-6-oxonona-2,4-dienedioate hydrolase
LGVSPRYFGPLIRVLEPGYAVTAPHLPQGEPVSRLAEVAATELHERSIVFANSLGCQVAVELALLRPELVERLVLVAPTPDPSAPTLRAHFVRLVRDIVREPLQLDWIVATDYLRNGPLRTIRGARYMLEHPVVERLPLVRAPAVVIRGERDPIVPQGWAEEVARLLPRSRLDVIPGAAHCAHFTHAEQVVAAGRVQPGA